MKGKMRLDPAACGRSCSCWTVSLQNYFTGDNNELLSYLTHCYIGLSVFIAKSNQTGMSSVTKLVRIVAQTI